MKLRRIKQMLLLACCCICCFSWIQAQQVLAEEKGSLRIHDRYGEGISFSIYQVAVTDENGYRMYTDEFSSWISELTSSRLHTENAGETERLAKELAGVVSRHSVQRAAEDQITDHAGMVTFRNLTPGYYLVLAASHTTRQGEQYSANPILVSLPESGETQSRETVIESKSEKTVLPTPTVPPAPPEKPKGLLPKTGVLWWPVPILAAAGGLFYLLGNVMKRQKRREEEQV